MTEAPSTYPDLPQVPKFVPSEAAVDTIAASLAKQVADLDWEEQHGASKGYWRLLALTALTQAGDQLVVASLAHVADNYRTYGFSREQHDDLVFAQHAEAIRRLPTYDRDAVVSPETPDTSVA